MLADWLTILKSGLARHHATDRICGATSTSGVAAAWRRLYPYFRRHRTHALLGAMFIGLGTLVGFAPPLITRYLVDKVILPGRLEPVLMVVGLLAACLAAEKILRLAEEFCFARFEQGGLLDIQEDLISRTLRLPKAFFDEQQTGYLTRRLTEDVESLRFLFSDVLANAAGQTLRLAGAAGFLFYLEWRIALLMLALLPALAWALRYFSRKVYLLSRERLERQAEAAGQIQESLADATTIKVLASSAGAAGKIMASLLKAFGATLKQSTVGSLAGVITQSIPGAGRALALAAGAVLVIRGEWTLGSLLAFQAYLSGVFGPAQYLVSVNLRLQQARAALERVSALFDIALEKEKAGTVHAEKLTGEIEFRWVSFAYDGVAPVLKDLALHIRPGEAVAVMGPSGVGKTTLVSLMLQFYKPTAGEIYFDGRPASEYDLDALRRRMGYVPQRPLLTSGTIMDNILCGKPEATVETVVSSARLAGLHEEVLSFPRGYQTTVGEGGLKLSEGQKQRVALARALVMDPDILILDEPTASLDAPTEQSILDGLSAWRKNRTLFVVTHRISLARRCDRVLCLDGDRLVEDGHQPEIDRETACGIALEPIAATGDSTGDSLTMQGLWDTQNIKI
jgi:ABC-type bacteriocin/lantibiotic exporter with double-glycine peptidase domain